MLYCDIIQNVQEYELDSKYPIQHCTYSKTILLLHFTSTLVIILVFKN